MACVRPDQDQDRASPSATPLHSGNVVHRPAIAYLLSLAALIAAVLLRWLLDPVMGNSLPLVTLFGAVAAAVWVGGYRPAVLVVLFGYAACNYFFIAPRNVLAFKGLTDIVGLTAYLFTCGIITLIGEAMHWAQREASTRREMLEVMLRSIGDAVITTDNEGRVTYVNRIAEALTGWLFDEAKGQPLDSVFRIVSESTRQPVESPASRALREGVVVGLANHTLLVRRDGTEIAIDDSAAPIRDEHGNVSGCVLIFRDFSSQRRRDQDRAREFNTARLLASIVESSDDAIVSKSLDGTIQSWNAGAERVFGHTAEQAIGRHISLVIPPERIAEEDEIVANLRAGRRIEHFETERMRRDGQRIRVSLTISPVKNVAGEVVGASKIARDITERKRVEAERERMATVIENSTDFIGICDLEGNPFFVNSAGLAMVGLDSLEEAQRTSVRDFFFPEDQQRITGEFLPSVLEHGHGETEVRFRNFKTRTARWMAYKVLTLNDADGKPTAIATVSQDITERRRMEDDLRKLNADLADVDRRKNEFIATLAHELRNPLAPLSNMLAVLKRADADPDVRARARETMERQLSQLVRLVDDLLDLNRITHDRLELRLRDVELSTIIRQAVEASRPLADAVGHQLTVSMPREPVHLRADPARLAQVFGNLLNNSCKYTQPFGQISIDAERHGDEVVVTVRDNGTGIPPDKLESIFDMFTQIDRSLERAQGGLGIGLTLVKRLVQMHGGTIEVKSAGEGMGSEFVVRLPVQTKPTPAAMTMTSEDERRLTVPQDRDT